MWQRRAFTSFFGIVLALILLELLMRLYGPVYGFLQKRNNAASFSKEAEVRILCLGDSTTAFGFNNSYPRQLERMLNERIPHKRFIVINEGEPGSFIEDTQKELSRKLLSYRPHFVITMLGVNDRWSSRIETDIPSWRGRIRLYRLWQFFKKLAESFYKKTEFLSEREFIGAKEPWHDLIISSERATEVLAKENDPGDPWHDLISPNEIDAQQSWFRFKTKRLEQKFYQAVQFAQNQNDFAAIKIFKSLAKEDASALDIRLFAYLGIAQLNVGENKQAEQSFDRFLGGGGRDVAGVLKVVCSWAESTGFQDVALCEKYATQLMGRRHKKDKLQGLSHLIGLYHGIISHRELAKDHPYFKKLEMLGDKYNQLGGQSPDILILQAYLYQEQERYLEVIKYLTGKEEILKTEACYWNVLAEVYFKLGRKEDAFFALRAAMLADPSDQTWVELCATYLQEDTETCKIKYKKDDYFSWDRGFTQKYVDIVMQIVKFGAVPVVMQYPRISTKEVEKIFSITPAIIINNEEPFNSMLKSKMYKEFFFDSPGVLFGHGTPLTNNLIAENIFKMLAKRFK